MAVLSLPESTEALLILTVADFEVRELDSIANLPAF